MKFLIISVLICFIFFFKGYARQDLDSLESVINTKQGTEKIKIINRIAKNYVNKDINIAEQLSLEGFRLADNLNFQKGKSEAAATLGLINYLAGQFNRSEYYCRIAMDNAVSLGDPGLEREVNTTLALVYNEQGNLDKGIALFKRNVLIDKNEGDSLNLALDYQNIGSSVSESANHAEAISYYLKAKDLFEALDNTGRRIRIYNYIGRVYLSMNIDSARYYLFKSFDLYVNRNGMDDFYDLFWNLSEYFNKRGMPDSSFYFLQKARIKAMDQGNSAMLLNAYQKISEEYEKAGLYREAYRYQKDYIYLKDSIGTADLQSRINDHVRNLERENKEQTMELLRKEAQIKDRQWLTSDILYYLIIGGIFLVFFIFIAFFARYRLYRKTILISEKLKQDLLILTSELSDKDELISDLKKREERLLRKNRILNTFIKRKNTTEIGTAQSLVPELKKILLSVNGDVVGLYFYNEYQHLIHMGEYKAKEDKVVQGTNLTNVNFPLYFESVRTSEYLISNDCRNDPRYTEFYDSRFSTVKTSRIDYPVKIEKKLMGIIYIEKYNSTSPWTDSEIDKIDQELDTIVPIFTKVHRQGMSGDKGGKPDLISIRSVFRELQIALLEKNTEGFIFAVFPDSFDMGAVKFRELIGKNWFGYLDMNEKERLSDFYLSLQSVEKENAVISYSIFDADLNKIRIREEVKMIFYMNGEKRIKSVINFED